VDTVLSRQDSQVIELVRIECHRHEVLKLLKNNFLKQLKGDFYQCGQAAECYFLHLEEFKKHFQRVDNFCEF
jgi:hypothetical protein